MCHSIRMPLESWDPGEDEDGLTLIIDRNKLTKKSKALAIKAIKDVLSQLEG